MQSSKPTHVRYLILFMLFLVTTINYADRATIAIAGSSLQKDLGIDAVTLGYIFSAFGWAYVAGQIPGGWLLDRFGSKKVYALSIFTWSLFTVLQGFVGEFGMSTAVVALFMLRFLVGEIVSVQAVDSHAVRGFEVEDTAAAVLRFGTGNLQLAILLEALESKGVVRTLAEPNLTSLSGQEATFLAGGEYPIPVSDDGNIKIEYKPFGVELNFTPTVVDGDTIWLAGEKVRLADINAITLRSG